MIPRVVDFLVYFFRYAPLTLGLDNSSCESDTYTYFDVPGIPDAPKQRARYHALHELLAFHISFEELVKRKKYLVLRVCPTLVQ